MSEEPKTQENSSPDNSSEQKPSAEELTKAKNDYLYLLAEFDNYRKNAIKERSELIKYGSERFMRDFLAVFDNFERALDTEINEQNIASFREGVSMIASEIRTLLQRHGVEEVKAQGKPFDPAMHEALSSEPRADMPAGQVVTVFQKAYKLHDKLIRPAQVTVSTAAEVQN